MILPELRTRIERLFHIIGLKASKFGPIYAFVTFFLKYQIFLGYLGAQKNRPKKPVLMDPLA